ncbi:hypothetical protein F5X98DRAFT_356774 [Xylaria grammica]|nr:hypothetical protein F5X98DRAFT_356774 [Xylaria grammica]
MGGASSEHVIPGTIYGGVPRFPRIPPYIPLPEMPRDKDALSERTAAMEWDTTVVVHSVHWPQIDNDRRHSGWEEVEKRWTQQQQGAEQEQQQPEPTQRTGVSSRPPGEEPPKAMVPYPHLAIPVPGLESECDFRMRVKLNSQSASMATGDGFKKWTTFTEGEWAGRLGHGIVVSGGQDSQDLVHGKTLATQVEATHRLKTADEIPAFIECKTRGFRTGPPELMRALQDPERAASVDARLVQYRVALSMKTSDERYAEKVNFGLWVGSCLWRGSEVIYDVYKIT